MADEADLDVAVQKTPTFVVAEPQEIHHDEEVKKATDKVDSLLGFWKDYFTKDSKNQPSKNIEIQSVNQVLSTVNFPRYGLKENTEPELRKRIEAGMADHLYSVAKDGLEQWVINRAVENELYLYRDKNGMSLLKTAAKLFPEVLEKYKKLQ